MNDCVCGHPRHMHSIYHDGRCIGYHTEPVIIGLDVVGHRREPCTCIEYQQDDGTDGNLRLHTPIIGKPRGKPRGA